MFPVIEAEKRDFVERLLLKGMNSSNCGQCRVQGCNFPTEA
jgi:hypothetical protein